MLAHVARPAAFCLKRCSRTQGVRPRRGSVFRPLKRGIRSCPFHGAHNARRCSFMACGRCIGCGPAVRHSSARYRASRWRLRFAVPFVSVSVWCGALTPDKTGGRRISQPRVCRLVATGAPAKIAILKNKAAAGDANAQYELGVAYSKGEGVPQDNTEAVKWVRLAAAQGIAAVQTYSSLATLWMAKNAIRSICGQKYSK